MRCNSLRQPLYLLIKNYVCVSGWAGVFIHPLRITQTVTCPGVVLSSGAHWMTKMLAGVLNYTSMPCDKTARP